jgi:hypothetical protein
MLDLQLDDTQIFTIDLYNYNGSPEEETKTLSILKTCDLKHLASQQASLGE